MFHNKWKMGVIVLLILNVFLSFQWYKAWQENKPYRKELSAFQQTIEKLEEEYQKLKLRQLKENYFLEYEKTIKDKEGKGLKGEIMIMASDQLLKSITLPFLNNNETIFESP